MTYMSMIKKKEMQHKIAITSRDDVDNETY